MAKGSSFAKNTAFVALGIISLLAPASARAQALNACDLNADGVLTIQDIQAAINMVIGLAPCTANISAKGVCDVVTIQRVTNAVLTGACLTGLTAPHTVTLNWIASTSSNVTGYNVYRGTLAGGPYTKLTTSPVITISYTDTTVLSGLTYYYVTTAINSSNVESAYSNQAQAIVPIP